jgi:uncharacterized phage protein gp47/JayE
MARFPTRADYFNIGAEEVFSRSATRPATARLTPEEVFTEGSDINIVMAGASAMADESTRHLAKGMSGLFLDSAEGDALDRLVADRFSPTIVRKSPTSAIVSLTYTRQDTTAAVSELAGKKVRTERGTEFELLQTISFAVGQVVASGFAQAVQPGTTGNVSANTVTRFVDPAVQDDMVVTNPEPASGGDERETDPRLRARARQFFVTARRGTAQAIEFGALTVGGVRSATALELTEADNVTPSGIVQVTIADVNGQANAQLIGSVQTALLEYRCAGVQTNVIAGIPNLVTIEYSARFTAGTNTLAAKQQLKTITINAVNELSPGEPLLQSLLYELLRSVPGIIADEESVVQPVGDLVILSGSNPDLQAVIRTNDSLVTVNDR